MSKPKISVHQAEKPWSRLRDESSVAYEAFIKYRDLGPCRSLDIAYRALQVQKAVGGGKRAAKKPSGQFFRTAAKFEWRERSEAWDDHRQKIRDRVAAQYAAKWEMRKQEAAEGLWKIGIEFEKRLEKMLTIPLTTSKLSKDGKTTIITPAKWNYQTVCLIAKTLAELKTAALTATTRPLSEYGEHELQAIRDAHDLAEVDDQEVA